MLEGFKPFYNAVLRLPARMLARAGVHPDSLTILGVAAFAAAGWYTALGFWKTALAWVILGACLDGLDGLVARESSRRTVFGAVFDSSCDRITEILWFAGLAVFYVRQPGMDPWGAAQYLIIAGLSGSLMVSYVKARAEGVGLVCNTGLLQRPERIILVCLFLLLDKKLMVWGLTLIAILSWITVLQRLALVRRTAK